MGTLKTHKGVKKRFRVTASGKVAHTRAGRRHLLTSNSGKDGRKLRRPASVAPGNAEKLRQLLHY
ncbi:MAG: 50S ribosomal protein L35 [Candidatus Omnitrophica bacterium]|nr:50S ribosomal protein L35 [Candidatus Omnitrophota bacterium]